MKSWLLYSKIYICIFLFFIYKLFSKCQTSLTKDRFSNRINVHRTLENCEDRMEYKKVILCQIEINSNKKQKTCRSATGGIEEKNIF